MDSLFDLLLGFIEAEGLLLKQGTCVDATIIDSTTRPPEQRKACSLRTKSF